MVYNVHTKHKDAFFNMESKTFLQQFTRYQCFFVEHDSYFLHFLLLSISKQHRRTVFKTEKVSAFETLVNFTLALLSQKVSTAS